MSETVSVTVQLFGALQSLCNGEEQTLELGDSEPTVGQVVIALRARFPAAKGALERSACAIGDRLVPRSQPLEHGAVLALIPPVSGG